MLALTFIHPAYCRSLTLQVTSLQTSVQSGRKFGRRKSFRLERLEKHQSVDKGHERKQSLQMLEVGQLEDLGWDGGQAVAVQPENLQTAGQVGEAAGLQRRDTIVVEESEGEQSLRTDTFSAFSQN